MPVAEVEAGASELAPPALRMTRLRPVEAHRLPPPAWHPKGAPLLKVVSSAWPTTMSPTDSRIGLRASRLSRAVSLVRVNTPSEPPLKVQVPWISGGISEAPLTDTLGLFGKLELPSLIGRSWS